MDTTVKLTVYMYIILLTVGSLNCSIIYVSLFSTLRWIILFHIDINVVIILSLILELVN